MEHPGAAILRALVGDNAPQQEALPAPRPLPVQARVLRDMLPVVLRSCPFQVGDLVQQIEIYSAYRHVDEDRLAIVSEVGPQAKTEEDQGIYRLDMRVLVRAYSANGKTEWREMSVESWRFKRYEGEVEP